MNYRLDTGPSISALAPLAPRAGRRLRGVLGAQSLHERLVRLRLHDLVELRAVVRHEAHALDDHVVYEPAAVLQLHAVIDGDVLGALLAGDPGFHRRVV